MNSPAFQFYVQDFLTGTMHMSAEEVGAYILLLCHQWDKGALPSTDRELLRIARTKMRVLERVKQKFTLCEDGLLRNMRLEKEREKQSAFRDTMKKKGEKGAEKRWHRHTSGITQAMPDDSSSSSSSSSFSSSTSSSEIEQAAQEPKDFIKQKNPAALDDIGRTVPAADWEHCLDQWNLAVLSDPHWQRTADEARDLRILLARLRKWCASWNYNLQKQNTNHDHTRHHRQGSTTDGIAAAALAVLSGDQRAH